MSMTIIKIMLLCMGLKVQKPVRRVSVKRSIFYTLICKAIARPGKRRNRSSKFRLTKPKRKSRSRR